MKKRSRLTRGLGLSFALAIHLDLDLSMSLDALLLEPCPILGLLTES